MNLNNVGKYIAKKRKEVGLTQQKLAELLNVGDKTISKWERGVNAPDISLLQDLAKALNTTVVNILNGDDSQKKDKDSKLFIDTISFYINKTKNKIKKILFGVILIAILLVLGIYGYEKYNQFFIYDIYLEDENFDLKGYFIYNSANKYLIINDINYNDIYVGTPKEIKTKEIIVSILCDDEKLFSAGYQSEDEEANEDYLNNFLDSVKIDLNQSNNSKIKLLDRSKIDKLYLQIEYVNSEGVNKIENLKLKVR